MLLPITEITVKFIVNLIRVQIVDYFSPTIPKGQKFTVVKQIRISTKRITIYEGR